MYVYRLAPIDFWCGWQTVEEAFRVGVLRDTVPPGRKIDAELWHPFWEEAKSAASELGWEGDIREGPYVTGLPDTEHACGVFMVGWKQDNNGTTFIASPIPLLWLENF